MYICVCVYTYIYRLVVGTHQDTIQSPKRLYKAPTELFKDMQIYHIVTNY